MYIRNVILALFLALYGVRSQGGIFSGTNAVSAVYYGTQAVSAVYSGTSLVWSAVTTPDDVLDGLVAWYKMDEAAWTDSTVNVFDSAGTYTGTSFGGAETAPGKIGRAGVFNGSSSYVSVPSPALSSFTWSLWVKAHNNSGNKLILNRDGTPPSSVRVCRIDQSGSTYSFIVFTAGGIVFPPSISVADTSLWNHIAITVDETCSCIYANGVISSQTPMSGTVNTSASEIWMAAPNETTGFSFFQGEIDDFRVYNRALSSNEVATIYNRPTMP